MLNPITKKKMLRKTVKKLDFLEKIPWKDKKKIRKTSLKT